MKVSKVSFLDIFFLRRSDGIPKFQWSFIVACDDRPASLFLLL